MERGRNKKVSEIERDGQTDMMPLHQREGTFEKDGQRGRQTEMAEQLTGDYWDERMSSDVAKRDGRSGYGQTVVRMISSARQSAASQGCERET